MTRRRGFGIGFLAALAAWGGPAAAADRPIVFATDPWPPLFNGAVDRPPVDGYGVELVRDVFARAGQDVHIADMLPWKRVLSMFKAGEIDVAGPSIKRADREEFAAFTDPIFRAKGMFFYRANRQPAFDWREVGDLRAYQLGLVAGYSLGPEIDGAIKDGVVKTVVATDDDTNLRMVAGGRIDMVGNIEIIGWHLINSNPEFRGKFKTHPKPFTEIDYHFMLSKASGAGSLKPALDAALAAMTKDGSIRRILRLDQGA